MTIKHRSENLVTDLVTNLVNENFVYADQATKCSRAIARVLSYHGLSKRNQSRHNLTMSEKWKKFHNYIEYRLRVSDRSMLAAKLGALGISYRTLQTWSHTFYGVGVPEAVEIVRSGHKTTCPTT